VAGRGKGPSECVSWDGGGVEAGGGEAELSRKRKALAADEAQKGHSQFDETRQTPVSVCLLNQKRPIREGSDQSGRKSLLASFSYVTRVVGLAVASLGSSKLAWSKVKAKATAEESTSPHA